MRPISQAVIDEIHRLLDLGVPQGEVCKRLALGHGVVGRVASGTYGVKKPVPRVVAPHGPRRYCDGCHARVQMPCLACYLRHTRKEKP